MKRFIQFILITVIVAGAGWVFWQDYRTGPIIDSRLDKYVNEWKRDMDSAGIRYKIIFNTTLDTIKVVKGLKAYGYSHVSSRTIRVKEELLTSEWMTRQTVYHELGHHIFSLDHVEDECIMFEDDLGESFYQNNWNNLVSKYINKAK